MNKYFFKVLILSLIIMSLNGLYAQEKAISLKDIYKDYSFYPRSVRGMHAMKDGEHYCKLSKEGIEEYSYKTADKTRMIVHNEDLKHNGETLSYDSYAFSPSEQYILFSTQTEAIYRHSTRSDFFIYDTYNKKLTALSPNGKQRLATFSPNEEHIAFVRDNNIFVVDMATMTEEQITTDGKHNHIINGTADWVYEEEFAFTKAFFWSPESNYIAYYKFDESKVREYSLKNYGNLYPRIDSYKYPKAGEDNSVIKILTYNMKSKRTKEMNIGAETDIYIPRIQWTYEDDKLAILWMNRLQNELKILLANASNGQTKKIYRETNKCYIEITDNLRFLAKRNKNNGFIITSELNGYNHIYHYDMEGSLVRPLTDGQWDVDKIIAFDANKNRVYYSCARTAPYNREVYAVDIYGGKQPKEYPIATQSGWNMIYPSASFKYYLSSWSDANHAPIYKLQTMKKAKQPIKVLEDNAAFMESIAPYSFQEKRFETIRTADGINLSTWMLLPPNFDENKKYPLLFTIYGGPGSQTVKNQWDYALPWHQMLAQQGIIVVSVDNRGTGFKGEAFKKVTYKELGKYEVEDQIAAAQYYGSLPYVDKERIGVFGWSFGGYMSTLCITKGADYFSTAIAVAPVTNWRYYDNIYTERYMQKPQDNASGYDENSPINHVDKLKGNYLLVHGMADDNVHPQNAYDLITALVQADRQFELMMYPNNNHGIYTGRNTRYHLYTKLTNFLHKHLLQKKR